MKRSRLKKCFIVRYADDFKIFCGNFEEAKRIELAVEDFLLKRLHLETSKEKTSITNLERNYSEFLGFKFKVYQKGNDWRIVSHMSDKAMNRTKENIKEALDRIKKTEDSANTMRAINDYNSIVYGVHQYFRIATMISEDVGNISYEIQHKCKSWKLKRRIKRDGGKTPKYIKDEYGASKQLRYINGMAIIPIGYCKHKNPMYKKKSINKYTSEGRQEIHKKLGVNSSMIQYMLRNPIMNRSIEYNDNRISLYSGQQGKCFVTKAELTMDNMHCHHKIPLHKGGTDEYANLVLVTEDVHVLIHAESEEVILKKIKLIRPDEKMRKKIDTLRRKAEISKIIWESYTF